MDYIKGDTRSLGYGSCGVGIMVTQPAFSSPVRILGLAVMILVWGLRLRVQGLGYFLAQHPVP